MSRPSGRAANEMRDISVETNVNRYAEGSCLIKCGHTHVLCTATVQENVPIWMRNKGSGWVTAEYGMLPRSTHDRIDRAAARGKQTGRTQEIQRLIGLSLRAIVDLKKLGERHVRLDCDVIQADGGTRTAAITGGFVAMHLAFQHIVKTGLLEAVPVKDTVSAISCGVYKGVPVADLDYDEDSDADTDANFVITGKGGIVEIQGTAEKEPFSEAEFLQLLNLAKDGCDELTRLQKEVLGL